MTGVGKAADRMGRKALMWSAAVALAAGTGALLPAGTAAAAASPTHARGTLRVATTGSDRGNCRSSPCKTLGHALAQASRNDTVIIYPGIYHESGNANVVKSRLTGLRIRSVGSGTRTVIDATGNANGIVIQASGVSVTGLTVRNANLEGILAEPPLSSWPKKASSAPANISHVTIAANVVVHNDRAYDTSLPPDSACPSSLTDADDCGEGIHLLGVSWSKVIGNNVSRNVGGILVSDGGFGISVGPAAHNLIAFNHSSGNAFDCGITLPGHDPARWPRPVRTPVSLSPIWPGCTTTWSFAMSRPVTAPPGCSTPRPTRGPVPTTTRLSATGRAATGTPASSSTAMRPCKTSAALSWPQTGSGRTTVPVTPIPV
jgi:hypothetical protein